MGEVVHLHPPRWSFEVDRARVCVWWKLSDGWEQRLEHSDQFAVLRDLLSKMGWARLCNALDDAELELSAVDVSEEVRRGFTASVAALYPEQGGGR